MASSGRRSRTPVIDRLIEEPHAFEFFQAVRSSNEARRVTGRLAADRRAGCHCEEPALCAYQALQFRWRSIKPQIPAMSTSPASPELAVGFLGLTGPSGVLPQHYTELLIRNLRDKNLAVRDFFDLFNHRLISLFHRAWEKYRLPATYERQAPDEDAVTACLMAIVGLDTPHLRNRLAVDDEAIVHFAGHYAHWPRSVAALEAILSDFFERRVRIQQFHGRWTWLSPDEFTALPARACGDRSRSSVRMPWWASASGTSGQLPHPHRSVRYQQFISFMPGSKDLAQLVDLTRLFVGPTFSFDMQLTLAKEEVPYLALAGEGDYVPRLGWNTWLKHEEFRQDASDAVFLLDRL
jgi:type VI secretion system protein ImpH